MCSLVLLLTISFQMLASYNSCLPSLLAFTYFMHYVCSPFTFAVRLRLQSVYVLRLQKPCRENFGRFQEFGGSSFGSSEKDLYFFKILKW